jgi:guanylate kinase
MEQRSHGEQDAAATKPGLIILVSAPSGGGKSSLCERLLKWAPTLHYSISCTTRAPRGQEQHGKDYFFLRPDEFEKRIGAGDFLEYAKYNHNYYGTPRPFVEQALAAGNDVLLDVEVQGALQVKERVRKGKFAYPDALVMIFLMPPSIGLLEKRLRKRGTDDEATIQRRLAVAEEEMSHYREYDYVIVSGTVDEDFAHGQAIVTAERCRAARFQPD